MAKKPSPDACMFCDKLPCVCAPKVTKATQKQVAKQRPKPMQQLPTPPIVNVRAAMKAAVRSSAPAYIPAVDESDDEADPEFALCLNVLEPILHPTERRKYSPILDTPEARALRWRMRNDRLGR